MMAQPIRLGIAALVLAALVGAAPARALADDALTPAHAIAMHGEPALGPDFPNLPYVNPDAPKGGRLTLAYAGAFDSLNPNNVRALSTAQGLNGNVYQTLMTRSADEPFTLYGLIAQTIETNAARDHVVFHLDPRAKFSDGGAITSEDVAFTFKLLKEKGRPQQRAALGLVKSIETPDALTVRCDLTGANDRELPMILALMPVLSRVHTDAEHFDEQTLQIPISSGPYVVAEVKPGERLVLKRDPNYWARDLPISRGLYNFDEIRIDYYRDATAMFEAFKAGQYDFRAETDPTRWRDGYDFRALRDGRVIKQSVANGLPKGMDGFAFNTRRAIFADARVREALAMMFDFEWINANLYGGVYRRSKSFFDDSELASAGRPATPLERALLAPFPGAVRADIMDGQWAPPVSDGSGRDRALAHRALSLLEEAGYALKDGALANARGERIAFEILVKNRQEERLALAYAQSLSRIGAAATVRLNDEVQYQRRRTKFDFDMMMGSWVASPSPGNEQRTRWGSASANMDGAYNICGAASPAIDATIAALLAANTHEDFVAAVRALDRVLISGFYIVPLYYAPDQWIAYSARLGRPDKTPLFGVNTDAWWSKSP
ncbi:extracellular solute-binding protein [Methylocapsa sp. S129]|uniref:extracellular solute-binding protein n=1 Tax=Methylocapsa sp. S129 TaxID=1641869 RepID=UPI00131D8C96|nr:extracellular solute-binding protein [Methylocapsa sp. S129]